MKDSLLRPFVSNLSMDFILSVPNYPSRLELGYPNHCLFGHVLEGSDPLENVGFLERDFQSYLCRYLQSFKDTKEWNKRIKTDCDAEGDTN